MPRFMFCTQALFLHVLESAGCICVGHFWASHFALSSFADTVSLTTVLGCVSSDQPMRTCQFCFFLILSIFLSVCLSVLAPFIFYIHFWVSWLLSTENTLQDPDWDCIEGTAPTVGLENTQWLRALAARAGDQSSITRTYIGWFTTTCNLRSRRFDFFQSL